MAFLTEQQLNQLAETVRAVEKVTDAELVTVLARASDNYGFIPTLWAAILALLTPALLLMTPFWLHGIELFLLQSAVFVALALIFRLPFIRYRLVPGRIRKSRAFMMARRMFLEQGLHHTKKDTGILIFVSEAEHYVEILVDRGISQHVDDSEWQKIIDQFVVKVKAGVVLEGFEECIASVAGIVRDLVPATEEKNELPDRLIVI
jgi:putative membrane protein